jgi:hypothetical protein
VSGADWLVVAIIAVTLIVTIAVDQAERRARWRRELERPLSPRARKWATEQEQQP